MTEYFRFAVKDMPKGPAFVLSLRFIAWVQPHVDEWPGLGRPLNQLRPLWTRHNLARGGDMGDNTPTARDEEFDLDVTTIERSDQFNTLVATTDDGCGSTCGACTTGVH